MLDQTHLKRAEYYLTEGRADLAIGLLEKVTLSHSEDFDTLKLLGFAYHEEQLEPEAIDVFSRAIAINGNDVTCAMAYAQSCFFSGISALDPFLNVIHLAPNDLNGLRGYASALAAEQEFERADSILSAALDDFPDWLAGHKLLASQRYTRGDKQNFADTYAKACAAQPQNLQLRLEWFRSVTQVKDWPMANKIIDEGERIFGRHPNLLLSRLFVASESGDDQLAETLFTETATLDDVVRDMALVRFCLRKGNLDLAEATAKSRLKSSAAAVFWPYLSLIWRLSGSAQAEWLDGSPPFISSTNIDFSSKKLEELAVLLRKLHTASSPFAEQSVRGGTQTDQNLFLRHEPIVRELRNCIQHEISNYVTQLPVFRPDHPLLGVDREDAMQGRVKFSGSWSVRLKSQGFNVSHTHPKGWISSALYIDLPKPNQMGEAPAGWIQFGTPPAELNLALEAYQREEPKPARLVLFPSTTWHSTVPFDEGERLVVAFDVQTPQPSKRLEA